MRGFVTPSPGVCLAAWALRAGVQKLPEGLIPASIGELIVSALDSTGGMEISVATRRLDGAVEGSAVALFSSGAEGGADLGGDGTSKVKSSGE